ncbi:MAG: FtsQ-type POTRA domain-containing protein [Corynebacterium sp.]|nr:FtsQ-type POTRA domain-containing protein [Corynebacterium sp.]
MRRWLFGTLAALVVVVCALAVVYVVPVVKVGTIAVEGAVHADVAAVQSATGVSLGENLMRVDTARAADGVIGVPWVKRATVSRAFPSTLRVVVEEQEAVAFVTRGDGTHLINELGQEFVIAPAEIGMIEIQDTPEGVDNSALYGDVLAVVAALGEDVLGNVARVHAPGRYQISLELLDGRTVYWGSAEQAAAKAAATSIVLTREGTVFNVSAPDLVTVS